MVNGTTRFLGGFTTRAGAQVVVTPSGRQVAGLNVELLGQRFSPSQQFFGGRFAGRAGFTPSQRRQEQQRIIAFRRATDFRQAKRLLSKARSKLLTPKERATLERITAPAILTRGQILARPRGALSRPEQLQERKRRQLEAQRTQVLSQQEKLDIRRQELDARFTVLKRLERQGLLQTGVVTIFNRQVDQVRKDQQVLIKRSKTTQKRIVKFQEPEVSRVVGVPKTAAQLRQTGIARELAERKAIQETIQRPFGKIDIKRTILETERVGRELGARFIGTEPSEFGARTGGVAGRILGGAQAGLMFVTDRPLFEFERFIGKPIAFEIPSETIIGRTIRGVQRLPILPDIFGISQVKPVTRKALEVRRPALGEIGASALLFFAPEAFALGARGARISARVTRAQKFFALEALAPKAVKAQAKRFGVSPFQVQVFKEQRLRQIIPTFEQALKQRQLRDLKQLRFAQRFERDIKSLLKERRGEFLPRRRPRQALLQIERPDLRVRIPVADSLRFARRDFFAPVSQRRLLAQVTRTRPRLPTALRVPTSLAAISAARTITATAQLFGFGVVSRQGLREFEQEFQRAQTRVFEIEMQRLFGGTVTRQRERETQRERQKAGLRLGLGLGLRTTTLTPTRTITVPRTTTRRIPPPPFLLLPKIEVPQEVLPEPKKVQGFFAMVKARPFRKRKFKKVSNALSMEAALQRGLRVADLTIAQSVKLVKSKKKVKRTFPSADRRFKFRKKGKTFIEKRAFAIDTVTEKQDLTVARFLKQEARGLFGGRRTKRSGRKRKNMFEVF